ncbi:MAG: hypothetical protein ACOY5C_03855 [Pseudomonadota bacterium]|uniref:hypothetical protein n=1 Tax=Thermithiobacillus tepidarius TaxID=929 RepID=UPI0004011422|nr:hypothetical protein [Thermithiobacillus tepidarius]
MKRVIWMMRRGLQRIGWQGAAGIGLLAGAAALHFTAIAPARAEIAQLQAEAGRLLQQKQRQAGRSPVFQQADPAAQLAAFYAHFPDGAQAPLSLDRIFQAAAQEKLQLEEGEYRIVADKGVRLTRYEITLPVTGPYIRVRRFVAGVLKDIPTASLDAVSFQKERVGDSDVKAQIKLTLYLGGA